MKKVYIIIGLLFVTAAVLLYWQGKKGGGDNYLGVGKSQKTAMSLPAEFPQDFPVDATVKDQAQPQRGPNGEILLQLSTNLTAKQAKVVYSDYFKQKGWQVLSKIDVSVGGSITAKSPVGDILDVSFSPLPGNKTSINASLAKAK